MKGLGKSIKRRSIFRWLHNQKHQFAFLQETHSTKECAQFWEAEWGGKVFFSDESSNSKGVVILVNPNLELKVEKCITENARYILLDLIVDESQIILLNIYARNDVNQQVTFFRSLQNLLTEFAQENIVFAGDFNCALMELDKKGGNSIFKKARVIQEIERLMNLYDLSDVWRRRNPDTERFTWSNKSRKIQVQLDFFLISKDLSSDVQSCSIVNSPESDHSAITLHLKSENLMQPKGPSFWKFNNSLLEDCEYVDKLREEIPLFKNKYSDVQNASLRWDLIKIEIRGFTIKFSKIKAKRRRNEEQILQKKANQLLEQTEQNPSGKKLLNELYPTNLRLRALMHQKTKGVILRSRARWQEQGEHNTKYFLNLEKRNHCRKNVTEVKINDNDYTSNQFEILSEERKFYETLYKSLRSATFAHPNETFFEAENVASLNEEEKLSREGIVSEDECLTALKEFKNCKSPGTDDLSAEFNKFFWTEISSDIIENFNYAFKTGRLSISQRRGIISLIPKKNKDKSLLENLRPISLLNIDYKILTKSIAKRLEKVLPKIINPNQTGYIKGRFISENVRLIQDAMFHTKQEEKPGIATFLDFLKAFDTVEWDYLKAALQRFNFGPDIFI